MIRLEVFGESKAMADVARLLEGNDDVRSLRVAETTRSGHAIVLATVRPRSADGVLDDLRDLGVPRRDITLTREDVVGRASGEGSEAGLVWEDVLGIAARNARPIARYLAFMFVAGVVAAYGIIDYNGILIVGAMAISPDLLPITAIGVGLVDRRLRLVGNALLTLVVGLAFASAGAAFVAFAQSHFGHIPTSFNIDSTVLGGLTSVGDETIVVALAAGIAGMLALETRASSGVGVAISVTTVPAAAYLGVALSLGQRGEAVGALDVLTVNVATLLLGASGTLLLQRLLARRAVREDLRRAAAKPGGRGLSETGHSHANHSGDALRR